MDAQRLSCRCVIVGGGPAGVMAGFLLARAGVDVIVVEKHLDFLRDFRGDTIHPSTMDVMAEVGLLEPFLHVPHQEVSYAEGYLGDEGVRLADLTHLPTRCKFIALMPQWDFLDFLVAQARRYPAFRLMMGLEALDLLSDAAGRIVGITAHDGTRTVEIGAELVIAADGRHSRLRAAARLPVKDLGAPMDVLWFKLAAGKSPSNMVLGRIDRGQALVMLDRGDYWQCALIIKKGSAEAVKREGLAAFRARVARLARRESADEIASLEEVKLLTVTVDRLTRWCCPGLLCIGDAAHAMSPIGGVGINLAIQDAVAAVNILAGDLRRGSVLLAALRRVARRRRFPTWATQAMQIAVQNRAIDPVLRSGETPKVPWIIRLMQRWQWLQRIPARLIGIGVLPEHVRVPEWPGKQAAPRN